MNKSNRNPYAVRYSNVIPFRVRQTGPKPAGRVVPAGQASTNHWVPAGTPASDFYYQQDAQGNDVYLVSVDASHNPISGTVEEISSGNTVGDQYWTNTGTSGSTTSVSVSVQTPNPNALNVNALVPAISGLLGQAGTDIVAIVNSNNALARQQLLNDTNVRLEQLRLQANSTAAQSPQNAALQSQIATLLAFQRQSGLAPDMTPYMVAGLVLGGIALFGGLAYVLSRGGSASASAAPARTSRRTSARRNPSTRRRRHRR